MPRTVRTQSFSSQIAKLCAAVLVAFSLAACGGGGGGADAVSPQAAPVDVAPAVTEINGTV